MKIVLHPDRGIVFDLDDTLYKERDFLESGFSAIVEHLPSDLQVEALQKMVSWWENGGNVFQKAMDIFPFQLTIPEMLEIYRTHPPEISLDPSVSLLLKEIKRNGIPVGLLTDGRSITQRNKVAALGLADFFDAIVVSEEVGSEKPTMKNFEVVAKRLNVMQSIYIGDNTSKDFLSPNELGWTTVCLIDDGSNIHEQSFDKPSSFLPDLCLDHLKLDSFLIHSDQ